MYPYPASNAKRRMPPGGILAKILQILAIIACIFAKIGRILAKIFFPSNAVPRRKGPSADVNMMLLAATVVQ